MLVYLCLFLVSVSLNAMSKSSGITNSQMAEEIKKILDSKLNPLQNDISELKKSLTETTKFLNLANSRYEEILKKFESFESQKNDLIAENAALKNSIQLMDQQIKQLQKESNDVRQYTRRDCLEIQGIPYTRNEDTNQIAKEVGDLMDIYIDDKDISISHRLAPSHNYKGKSSTPAIIVKFVRRDVKEKYYKARKKLKEFTVQDLTMHDFASSSGIYINESLTDHNKEIFKESLRFKKINKFDFIWTSNGRTYLRKDPDSRAVPIINKEDLKKLQTSAGR